MFWKYRKSPDPENSIYFGGNYMIAFVINLSKSAC